MKLAIAISTLLLVCVGAAFADVGRIPIYEPVTLTSGGHYYVSRAIPASTGGGGVIIDIVGDGNSNIEIDLNGFFLGSTTEPVIRVGGAGMKSVVLRNGTVQRSGSGAVIEIVGVNSLVTDDLIIENVRVRGGNTVPDTGIHITDVNKIRLSDNIIQRVHTGVLVRDTNSPDPSAVSGSIERNHCNGVDTVCINLATRHAAMIIAHNTINFVGSGIVMQSPVSCQVVDNSIQLATGDGLKIDGTSQAAQGVYVARNTFNAVVNDAIALVNASRCKVIENVISNSDGDGIYITGGEQHQIDRNLINGNDGDGIYITGGGHHQIEGNVVNGNAGYGLHMDGSNDNVYATIHFVRVARLSPLVRRLRPARFRLCAM